ncbi:MAG: DUF2190 family protein, partial [Deltaproteobacteria bacterium]|nr:DUF2190 family protein [Deltaproteobacteria bacterium]
VAGEPLIIGGLFVTPVTSAAATFPFTAEVCSVRRHPKSTSVAFTLGAPVYWDVADEELNDDDANLCVGHAVVAAAEADTHVLVREIDVPVATVSSLDTRIDALEAAVEDGGTLETRVDDLEDVNGVIFHDSNAGAGDQVNMTDTNAKTHTEKCSVPAALMAADDILVINFADWVDDQDSNPQLTFEVLVGTTVVATMVIATAADNDWVKCETRIKCTAVGASITGEISTHGAIKGGTIAAHNDLQKAVAITASTTAGFDVTARCTSNAGHADNKATLRNLDVTILRGTAA